MLILKGKNLGERQKELNIKVREATSNNIDFEEIKDKPEQSDIDKLFKIDLASKHMNIEYIIDVLKSGDSLHISRALKCTWMYDSEFAHIINVDYLHHNVFPFMSQKMKKKLLTAIYIHVRDAARALAFYKYCMGIKLTNIALKFVIFTSDAFKLEFLRNNSSDLHTLRYKNDFKHFIGSSFILADAHLATQKMDSYKTKCFDEISYLYSVSDVKYLDMLEKYVQLSYCKAANSRSGLRISKDIFKKHKDRVLKNPCLYINFLNKMSIIKYSTPKDAKIYILALLPVNVDAFWNTNFCMNYEYLLNILPAEQRFDFIKEIFNDKYPEQLFEMDLKFHKLQYYKFMTVEQKEKWALDQITSQNENLGIGRDFLWYKFVSFDKAFEEIKKLVMITPDSNKRAEIINVLIETAKTQRDLEKLFKYYYDRHNNEQRYTKENFIDLCAYHHNVYTFDKDCWNALNKIFQNLEVYCMLDYNNCKTDYKIMALIYHVINEIDVHDALKLYISSNMYYYTLKLNTDKLTKEQQEMVYQYLFKFYMAKIDEFDSVPYDEPIKYQLRKYIHFILDLLHTYDRTKKDIPEVVMKLMTFDWDEFYCHKLLHEQPKKTTQADLLRYLKKDAKLVVENLPAVKKNIEMSYRFDISQLLKKLKVYFSNDISKEYIEFYTELLAHNLLYPKVAQAATYGIFQLADDNFKVDFMTKHAPTQSKINRSEIDESLLNIQEAICATAFYSRPPVPLKTMLMYVKGDYVRKCLPLFNSYLANLPLPLCMNFIEAVLKTPVSSQKHGLRLAFACFSAENLKKLVLYIWKKTNNVSLRLIIYKALFNKLAMEGANAHTGLFETLNTLTLDLNQDDDQEIFALITSEKLPRCFVSEYIAAAWSAVDKLPKNKVNYPRKTAVIKYMFDNIRSIRQDIVRPIVQTFIHDIFGAKNSTEPRDCSEFAEYVKELWQLTANHITYLESREDLHTKVELTKYILTQCVRTFSVVEQEKYAIRSLFFNFIRDLISRAYLHFTDGNEYINEIFEIVLGKLKTSLNIEDSYNIVWEIRIDMTARNILYNSEASFSSVENKDEIYDIFRQCILNFGKDIGALISEYKELDMYIPSFVPVLTEMLINKAETMVSWISNKTTININTNDVLVITGLGLIDSSMIEMYLLALHILPSDYCGQYVDDYIRVLNEIKEVRHMELRYLIYKKFVYTDFKPRPFLLL